MTMKHSKQSIVIKYVLASIFMLTSILPLSCEASIVNYALNFTDTKTSTTGTGSFVWNTNTEIMSSLTWNIAGHTGSVLDTALARTYHSYDALAGSYGELFYRYLTAPQAFLIAEYGLLSASNGLMPYDVSSDYFGFVAFGAQKTSSAGTYLFYDKNWKVASEGYVTASAVPLPAAAWLMGSCLLGFTGRGKRGAKI